MDPAMGTCLGQLWGSSAVINKVEHAVDADTHCTRLSSLCQHVSVQGPCDIFTHTPGTNPSPTMSAEGTQWQLGLILPFENSQKIAMIQDAILRLRR